MSKRLLPTLAIALLLTSASSAYSFDYNRFSSTATIPTDIGREINDVEGLTSRDTFALAPSGQINRVLIEADLNTKGLTESKIATTDSDYARRAAPSDEAKEPNTFYSISPDSHTLTAACGPSPMTAAQIEELVGQTAQIYGVDASLAKAIAWTESRYDQTRNSPQGARGPMQLMPATATGLGVVDICDPVANIDGGIRYLKLMLEEFQNPILAAAAYNAGAQAVYDSGGVPPFGETVRYVADVINHQMGLKKPRKAGARGIAANKITPSANEIASDVIGARGSRFIKGVMQF